MKVTVNKVYKEEDYSVFKRLSGNRGVKESRKNKIISSINDVGYIQSPIIVNEKMEVIDGQGRLEAAKQLKLPVYYCIVPGIGLKECVSMNINQENWKPIDYIRSYAENGNVSYKYLLLLCEQFPMFDISTLLSLFYGSIAPAWSRDVTHERFKCTEEEYNNAVKKFPYIARYKDIIKEVGSQKRPFYMAVSFCYDIGTLDLERLYNVIDKNKVLITPTVLIAEYLSQFEDFYNKNLRNKKDILCKYVNSANKKNKAIKNALIRSASKRR